MNTTRSSLFAKPLILGFLLVVISCILLCVPALAHAVEPETPATPQTKSEQKEEPKLTAAEQLAKDTPKDLQEDHTYIIISALDSSKTLDVAGGSTSNSANVQLYEDNHTQAQQWTVSYDDKGFATITNVKSNRTLDARGGASSNGTNIQQYESNSSPAQKWILVKESDGYKIVSALNANMVLDVASASTRNGANVQLYESNNSKAQRWFFNDLTQGFATIAQDAISNKEIIETGDYTISSTVNPSYVLDVASGSTANCANVQAYATNGTDAQKWSVSYDKNGYAIIKSMKSGKVLDVRSAQHTNGANVWQYEFNDSPAQKWIIKTAGNDSYFICSALWPNMVLDLSGARAANGSNIHIYSSNGTAAQKWYFVPASPVVKVDTSVVLDEGAWYSIQSKLDTSYVIDIASASRNDGANAQLYKSNGTLAQLFQFKKFSAGVYYVANGGSDKVLDVDGGKTVPGTNIQQWSLQSGNKNQLFTIRFNKDDSTYSLVNLASGLALDVANNKAADGSNIVGSIYNANDRGQHFALSKCTNLLSEGFYTIGTNLNSSLNAAVKGASYDDNATLELESATKAMNQKWQFAKVAGKDNTFTIQSLGSGKYLTAQSGGTGLFQMTKNGANTQYWVVGISLGGYTLKNVGSGNALDVNGAVGRAGTKVQTYAANGTAAQSFKLTSAAAMEDAVYSIRTALDTNKALDVDSGLKTDSANVQIYTYNSTSAQLWRVTKLSDGSFTIINEGSGKALDVYGGGATDGTNVQQYTYNDTPAQKWKITWDSSKGAFVIETSLKSGMRLEVAGAKTADRTNVQILSSNGSKGQLWEFVWSPLSGSYLQGVDIFSGEGRNGINLAALSTTDFFIVKVSEGTYYENPYWYDWANQVLAMGKKLGLYHYAGDGASNSAAYAGNAARSGAEAQASYFVSKIGNFIGKAVLVIDWEGENNTAYRGGQYCSFVKEFADSVKAKTGVTPWIYLCESDAKISQYQDLGNPLWVAKYAYDYYYPNTTNYVANPKFEADIRSIRNVVCYQYSSCGRIAGYGHEIDINKFFGTAADWDYYASRR